MRAKTKRVGMAGYVRLLARLRMRPSTIPDAVGFVGVGRGACYRIITTMHHLKLVHVSAWSTDYDRRTLPVYAYGPGEDAPAPALRPCGRPTRNAKLPTLRDFSSEVVGLHLLIKTMAEPVSKAQIGRETGMHDKTIRTTLAAMVRYGLAYIDHWAAREAAGGPPIAHFQFGTGVSAPRPKPISRKEINRFHNAKRRDRQKFLPLVRAFSAPASNEAQRSAA